MQHREPSVPIFFPSDFWRASGAALYRCSGCPSGRALGICVPTLGSCFATCCARARYLGSYLFLLLLATPRVCVSPRALAVRCTLCFDPLIRSRRSFFLLFHFSFALFSLPLSYSPGSHLSGKRFFLLIGKCVSVVDIQ